jgi:hypothetical protein
MTGDVQFGEDGKASIDSRTRERLTIDMPCACLTESARERLLKLGQLQVDGDRCTRVTTQDDADTVDGLFEVDGDKLYVGEREYEMERIGEQYGAPDAYEFCVKGDRAWLSGVSGDDDDRVILLKKK